MKKLLLGSTALVAGGLMAAPAMAADPIKIGVGGYYQFYALAGNIEGVYAPTLLGGAGATTLLRVARTSVQYKGLQFIQEGEIHFIGQSKLDNGTTVGLTVELEGWNNSVTSPRRPCPPDRRSVPVRLRRLGPHRVRRARPGLLPYVLRRAVGAVGLGLLPAQLELQLGKRRHARQPGAGCGDVLHDRRPVSRT